MKKVLGVTKARETLSSIVERVQHQGDTYLISRHGKPAAAVVPVPDGALMSISAPR